MAKVLMTPIRWSVVLLFCLSYQILPAQITKEKLDSICLDRVLYNLPEQSLGKGNFIFTPFFAFKIVDKRDEYGIVQLGRREKEDPFIYIKLSPSNTCVTSDVNVHLSLSDDSVIDAKNLYSSNCNGLLVVEMAKNEFDKLSDLTISKITVDAFDESLVMDIPRIDGERMRYDLYCLKYKKF